MRINAAQKVYIFSRDYITNQENKEVLNMPHKYDRDYKVQAIKMVKEIVASKVVRKLGALIGTMQYGLKLSARAGCTLGKASYACQHHVTE